MKCLCHYERKKFPAINDGCGQIFFLSFPGIRTYITFFTFHFPFFWKVGYFDIFLCLMHPFVHSRQWRLWTAKLFCQQPSLMAADKYLSCPFQACLYEYCRAYFTNQKMFTNQAFKVPALLSYLNCKCNGVGRLILREWVEFRYFTMIILISNSWTHFPNK